MKRIFLLSLIGFFGAIISCKDDEGGNPTPQLDTPEISVDATSIDFGNLDLNQESEVKAISVSAVFLEDEVTASVTGDGFQVSLSESGDFGSSVTIPMAGFSDDASVPLYVKAVPADGFQGALTASLTLTSTGADDVNVSLSASVALEITGELWMSEYFEQYGSEWKITLPLDSGILGWNLNTDTVVNQANAGGGYPETTVPNNEVMNVWYLPIPLNGATLRASLGLSDASSLSITGYPAVPGARDVVLDPADESQFWNWINKNNGSCKPPKETGNNTSAARRFAPDGNRENVFMSALVNVTELGSKKTFKDDDFGKGDIIALASATSGSSNNDNVKIVAITDDAGGFHFGLIKENEGNPLVLSEASYSLGTAYAVVLSHEFVDGDNNDISKLYVFAEGDEIPTSMADATPVATIDETYADGAGVDPKELTIVFMRERQQDVNAPTARVTGIRVGTSWVATLFADHSSALNSNDLTLHNRVLTNEGSSCTP